MPTALHRTSTVEEVAALLRERILAGSPAPGTWLRETELARELEVSRNTLRQAFQALARAGLVERLPHRGVRVKSIERADVLDILRARRCLEDAALARCERPAALGERLTAIAAEIERAEGREAWARLVDLDIGFHRAIVESVESERLARFFDDLLGELRLALVALDRREAGPAEPLAHVPEHRAIAEAVAHGDLPHARGRLARHLDEAEAGLLDALGVERS